MTQNNFLILAQQIRIFVYSSNIREFEQECRSICLKDNSYAKLFLCKDLFLGSSREKKFFSAPG